MVDRSCWLNEDVLNYFTLEITLIKFKVRLNESRAKIKWRSFQANNYFHYNPKIARPINNGAKTSATRDITVIMVLREGPAVSLKGSPTVSPITAAL